MFSETPPTREKSIERIHALLASSSDGLVGTVLRFLERMHQPSVGLDQLPDQFAPEDTEPPAPKSSPRKIY